MKNILKEVLFATFMVIALKQTTAQQQNSPLYLGEMQKQWVDSVYNTMSLDEKVGQLFIVAAYTNKGNAHEKEIENLIKKERIGGLIFMQDNAERQITLTQHFQKITKIPLLIGMDAEWDISMRLKNTNKFPWAMTMGALRDNELIYKSGAKIAEHLKTIGVHFNFAPVVDVNVNPENPIIGNRSFGEVPERIAEKATAYMRGLQEQGILSSAKHFPGHGDTSQDSHKTLPTIPHDKERLNNVELLPFKILAENGITAIMVAHLNLPAYEKNPKKPASLSKNIITRLLKEQMGFKGLIITDALNMSGVTKNYPNGESDYMAFEAGNDILLFSQAVKKGKQKIIQGIKNSSIPLRRLEESVKKILMAKYYAGLYHPQPLSTTDIMDKLNDEESKEITYDIFKNAITLLKNEFQLPYSKQSEIGWLPLEEGDFTMLSNALSRYPNIEKITPKDLKNKEKIIITLHKSNVSPYSSYTISEESKKIIEELSHEKEVLLCVLGSPYALKNIDISEVRGIIVAYQNHREAMKILPELLFGKIPFKGVLPVTVGAFKAGEGIDTEN